MKTLASEECNIFIYRKINLLIRKNLQKLSLNIPNLLSISRLFFVFPIILFLEINRPFYVFILLIIGGLTDYFDGLIARKFNLKTRLGAILDPLSDKVLYLIPLVSLCKNNLIPFWSLTLILFRELIISSLRNVTKNGLPASMLGKFKTFFFFISVITFFIPLKISSLNNLALIFYWLGFIFTFVTLLGYLRIKKNMI